MTFKFHNMKVKSEFQKSEKIKKKMSLIFYFSMVQSENIFLWKKNDFKITQGFQIIKTKVKILICEWKENFIEMQEETL